MSAVASRGRRRPVAPAGAEPLAPFVAAIEGTATIVLDWSV